MTAGTQRTTALIRVTRDVYEELVELQQEFTAEHGGKITLSQVIRDRLLADRKPVRP